MREQEACSLLVLWSLTVINMGSSGWHPWPCWDPSPRAQLSSPKVAPRCPCACQAGLLLLPSSPCSRRRERRRLAGCPGRDEGRASLRLPPRERRILPLRAFADGE